MYWDGMGRGVVCVALCCTGVVRVGCPGQDVLGRLDSTDEEPSCADVLPIKAA